MKCAARALEGTERACVELNNRLEAEAGDGAVTLVAIPPDDDELWSQDEGDEVVSYSENGGAASDRVSEEVGDVRVAVPSWLVRQMVLGPVVAPESSQTARRTTGSTQDIGLQVRGQY